MQSKESRQNTIVAYAKQHDSFQTHDIVESGAIDVTRLTVARDLAELVQRGVLVRLGKGRAAAYTLDPHYRLHEQLDVEKYYARPWNERDARAEFNPDIFRVLQSDTVFTDAEAAVIKSAHDVYAQTQATRDVASPAIQKREWERLVVELSWKSSEIEGNTYSLLETEALLKEARVAEGKSRADAQMILNHKSALDHILSHPSQYETCSVDLITGLHEMLVTQLMVSIGFRDHPVGITGTVYRPLPRANEVARAMGALVELCTAHKDPVVRSFLLLIMLSCIQPFEDGNKRTARLIANAHLFAHGHPMLSYRTVDSVEYKKAMLLFYEQNNFSYIKQIFIEQYRYAVNSYFAATG